MANTYNSSLFHCVFSTKERRKSMGVVFRKRLWAFMGGIARENNIKALSIGGTEDHVHMLLSLSAATPVAKAMQLIKGSSSRWVNENFQQCKPFAWQEGYGAFSISFSQIEKTIDYINTQEQHHRIKSFQEEYLLLLDNHNLNYDERYVWG